ncbi:hypothetical protein D9M68_754490 [compost metagenome]
MSIQALSELTQTSRRFVRKPAIADGMAEALRAAASMSSRSTDTSQFGFAFAQFAGSSGSSFSSIVYTMPKVVSSTITPCSIFVMCVRRS